MSADQFSSVSRAEGKRATIVREYVELDVARSMTSSRWLFADDGEVQGELDTTGSGAAKR